jgi:hypothetical protein
MKSKKVTELDNSQLDGLAKRVERRELAEADYGLIIKIIEVVQSLQEAYQCSKQAVRRFMAMLFGAPTERTGDVIGKGENGILDGSTSPDKPKAKRKGHGRRGADQYPGAKTIYIPHKELTPGMICPAGCGKHLYDTHKPAISLHFRAQPLIDAARREQQRLRCCGCGVTFTAKLPEDALKKYDESVGAALGVARYGFGLPMNRMVDLQNMFGIPMPLGTQYEEIEACYKDVGEPIMTELIHQAAQGTVVYNDDTPGKVLDLKQAIKERRETLPPDEKMRTGIFTTGIVSTREERTIVLYATGNKHAGENLHDVLVHRPIDMPAPIQMCDGLSRNNPGIATDLANCGAHARREFVSLVEKYRPECAFVLETYRCVYVNEAHTKKAGLSIEERLLYHQQYSIEPMNTLKAWMGRQMEDKLVEPNSVLGGAIQYSLKRWDKLTLFLRKAGAPIDNNICERILKTAIRHRNNSLFYKTENGAKVGDFFMSVIQTCRFCNINPINYLATLRRKIAEVAQNPAKWMPWNYLANDIAPA